MFRFKITFRRDTQTPGHFQDGSAIQVCQSQVREAGLTASQNRTAVPFFGPAQVRSYRAWSRVRLPLLAAVLLFGCVEPACALRPFDATDAAVAAPGEFELELGPLGRLREGSKRFRVAPAVIGNFGYSQEPITFAK